MSLAPLSDDCFYINHLEIECAGCKFQHLDARQQQQLPSLADVDFGCLFVCLFVCFVAL